MAALGLALGPSGPISTWVLVSCDVQITQMVVPTTHGLLPPQNWKLQFEPCSQFWPSVDLKIWFGQEAA